MAKLLITLATLFYGIVPLLADLNETHLLNPNWMPHAKLHLAWLLGTNSLLALYSMYLIWIRSLIIQAGLIGGFVMLGFWIAAVFKNSYGGLFVDPNIDAPTILGLNPNVFAFMFVTIFLVAGISLEIWGKNNAVSS